MDFGNCVLSNDKRITVRRPAMKAVRALPVAAPNWLWSCSLKNNYFSPADYDIIDNHGYIKNIISTERDGSPLICHHYLDTNYSILEAHSSGVPPAGIRTPGQQQGLANLNNKTPPMDGCATTASNIDPRPHIIADKTGAAKVQQLQQQQQQFAIVAILFLTFLLNENALLCHGFGDTEFVDDTSLVGYNYFKRFPFLNSMRMFQNDPTSQLMTPTPPSTASLSSDQTPLPQGQLSNSWTSMLTNPFGGPKDDLDLHVRKILIPRVSGTQGNIQVREYISNILKNLNYHVELDEFVDDTPIGKVRFANIIASSNPNACRQLVIACHHDSKMMDGFLGAVDSAVPCAMMLKMADTFRNSFRSTSDDSAGEKDSLGLRFVFFDGEEAFVNWGPTDSLYGSRHLAAKWERQAAPSKCDLKNELARIEMLMVLDLIGSKDTSFINYNLKLKGQYQQLQMLEKQHLERNGLTSSQIRREAAFKNRYIPLDFLEDDHVPFHKRGVPVLSLLAHPFPKVWHTIDDNYSAIDFPRTRRLTLILEQFVANYTKELVD